MGMRTHVYGVKPLDEKWKKMKKVYDSCIEANVEIPEEVDDFFEGEPPNEIGVEVDISNSLEKYHEDMREGFIVNLKMLPKHVTKIVFYNSY